MKKILPAVMFLILIPGIMIAQRTSTHREETPAKKELPTETPATVKNKNTSTEGGNLVLIMQMDQRKIYNWGNGQRSTPTGRVAGEERLRYARVFGDSAVVVKHPFDDDQRAYSKKAY